MSANGISIREYSFTVHLPIMNDQEAPCMDHTKEITYVAGITATTIVALVASAGWFFTWRKSKAQRKGEATPLL